MNTSQTSFSAFVELWKTIAAYRLHFFKASVCSVLNTTFDVMPEILIGIAIDVVVNQKASFLATLGFEEPKEQIVLLGALTLFIWFGESLFQYLYLILWRNLAQDIQADLRQRAYRSVQRQGMAFFESRSSGEIGSVLNDDVNQLERFLDTGVNDFLQVLMSVILVGGVFFYISPSIALFAIAPIPVVIWGAFYYMRKAEPLYAEVRQQVGYLANRIINNLGGIATIKAFNAEDREDKRLREISSLYVQANRSTIKVSSFFIPVIRMAILTGFLATFIIGGFKVLDGELNVGAYGMLVFLTQRLLWPLARLAQTVDLYERAMASSRRIITLIKTPNTVSDEGTQQLPIPTKGDIQFHSASFSYAESGAGVQGISLHIPAGKTVALVGATGSGKSTLIKLLLRFYPLNDGSITIDSMPINSITLNALRGSIGLVSQDVFLFEGSVSENIAYANPDASHEQIEEAARAADALHFIQQLPNGFETLVGERGVKLSGGQRQRLSLARAILKNPAILILDEATSAVDNETEAAIQRSLAIISKQRTVLVVAHRLSTIVSADQIVVLDQGAIVEQGTHAELLTQNGYYKRQWMVQTGEATHVES